MAVITLSGLISSIKGSVNGSTFQRSAAGTIVRNKPKSVGKGSFAQRNVRSITSTLNGAWRDLTDSQRNAWAYMSSFANGSNLTTKGNRSANTGKMQFLAVNFFLLQYGKSIVTDPSIGSTEAAFLPCPSDYQSSSNLMNYTGVLDTTEQVLITKVSLPQSNSTNTANTGMRTLVYSQVDGSQQDWSQAYFDTYGIVPPWNYKYWIELQVVNFVTGALSAPSRRLISYTAPSTALGLVVDTTKTGSASDTFVLPCGNTGTYNATIYRGDGSLSTITAYNDANLTHVYPSPGVYHIYIDGSLPHIRFNNSGDKLKLIDITQWGGYTPLSLNLSFFGCANLVGSWNDAPDLSSATNMLGTFSGCLVMGGVFSGFDVSTISVFSFCFTNCLGPFSGVSYWDVSAGISFTGMYSFAFNFNEDLSTWDVSNMSAASDFCNASGLSTANLDLIYNAWALLTLQPNVAISFGSTTYTSATSGAARAILTGAPNNWTIIDGGGV